MITCSDKLTTKIQNHQRHFCGWHMFDYISMFLFEVFVQCESINRVLIISDFSYVSEMTPKTI